MKSHRILFMAGRRTLLG